MSKSDTKRLPRLTAIITILQSHRLVVAQELATRFGVSVRTIYRDIRSLEESGIPIYVEEGKGYRILDTFRLPPVMFNENEANALIIAEQLVLQNSDASLVHDYASAIDKIKSVLSSDMKHKANLLSQRTQPALTKSRQRTSTNLATLQYAITNYLVVDMAYLNESGVLSHRLVEPFSLLSTRDNWLLLAWCRLRNEYRYFRLDRIQHHEMLSEVFQPHSHTLEDIFNFGK